MAEKLNTGDAFPKLTLKLVGGGTATLQFRRTHAVAALHVLRVDVVDPAGARVRAYSGNVLLGGATASWRLPFALNDAVGSWRVRVTDVLTGRMVSSRIAVEAR